MMRELKMKQIKLSPKRQAEFDKIVKWFMTETTTHLKPKDIHAEMTRVKILSHLACLQGLLTDHISEHPLRWKSLKVGDKKFIHASGLSNDYRIHKEHKHYCIAGVVYAPQNLTAAKAICQLIENDCRRELPHV